jgi:hypothetical protein
LIWMEFHKEQAFSVSRFGVMGSFL